MESGIEPALCKQLRVGALLSDAAGFERADRIVALEAGRVAEQGTHAQLLAKGGLYARLHALQFRSAGTTP